MFWVQKIELKECELKSGTKQGPSSTIAYIDDFPIIYRFSVEIGSKQVRCKSSFSVEISTLQMKWDPKPRMQYDTIECSTIQ